MKQLTSDQIRDMFLEYFRRHDHMIEPGASLVPINDPTLLWINSGVAALKKYFDGTITPPNNRIANAQKSIRTNDIEIVGKTARHQTFFEMLGNFSIGDYFKEDAIKFAWEFSTSPEWMGFDPDKIYVSIHPDDDQAYDIWVNVIGFDPQKILKSEENFWQIGDGPCGPNSELYYDRGEKYDPEGIGEKLFFEELENDRYVEYWNVVFSQYDGKEGEDRRSYKELPQKNIDTGMGFERLVMLAQGVATNFDTDIFLPIIKTIENYCEIMYGGPEDMAFRVIADHLRTVTFALADRASFSNEGRGYILRRVLRRAIRYARRLDIRGAFMYKLVKVVADNMQNFYPYLQDKIELISRQIKAEEERFHLTLSDGENLLNDLIENCKGKQLDGKMVFKLYDTYGYPVELTGEIAEDRGLTVDIEAFNACMEEQRNRAREAREDIESMVSQSIDLMEFKEKSEYIGYDELTVESRIIALFKDGKRVNMIADEGDIVFEKTVFYAESGGQIADSGTVENDSFKAVVSDVKKAPNKQHLVHIKAEKGEVKIGDVLRQQVDVRRRTLITRNHTCGHLLQTALWEVLGSHVQQAGSLITVDYFRFDFTHFSKMTPEEERKVEALVNEFISRAYDVDISYMGLTEAKEAGATALFDEKYGDVVRVIKIDPISMELCGGCHVKNIAEIGLFKILSEESIGSGIRRITACTNITAYQAFKKLEDQLTEIAGDLKLPNVRLINDKVRSLNSELDEQRKKNALLKAKLVEYQSQEVGKEAQDNGLFKVLIYEVKEDSIEPKSYAEKINRALGGIVLAYRVSDKVVIGCACSEKAIENGYKAGELVKQAAVVCGGNGGGRPDLAQAGGKEINKVDEMIKIMADVLKFKL